MCKVHELEHQTLNDTQLRRSSNPTFKKLKQKKSLFNSPYTSQKNKFSLSVVKQLQKKGFRKV